MAKNSQDELARAYAILFALRKNINQITKPNIEETYVNEFHSALDKLEGTGIDISEFRIPDSKIAPIPYQGFRAVSIIPGESVGPTPYTKERYIDKQYFLTKIDAILGYFEIITSEKPKSIGFRKPED